MKRNILIILLAFFSVAFAWAQQDFVPQFDGTKYYMLIYDGEGNEKVLSYKTGKGWNEAIGYSDFFDGSNSQLWVFEEPSEYPGYINVRNLDESLSDKHFLKSWSWNAYLESQTGDREGDQERDMELIFRFKHVFDGWQAFETIEKPSGLYGIEYTPGPDALNINANGVASFNGLKTSDITQQNAAFKVFKLVKFDPMELFVSAIDRGQAMYDDNAELSAAARLDLFYILEKARETRVFGTEGQMLAYQTTLDEAINKFYQLAVLADMVNDAKAFIEASEAGSGVKASFNEIIEKVEVFITGELVDFSVISDYKNLLQGATNLVNAIVAAETYYTTLTELDDPLIASGMMVAIDDAKAVLANPESNAVNFGNSVSVLGKVEELLNEVIAAKELIANTQEFEEAKQILNANISDALAVANTSGISSEELTAALKELKDDIKAFKKALEAGDTVVALENPGFEDGLNMWASVSDDAGIPYTQNNGVDGSVNMAVWKGADYHVMTYQSLAGIPNGKYQISMMAVVSEADKISFFAQSGSNSTVKPLAFEEWSYTKRVIEVVVTDGTLQFGIKGSGVDNMIPANVWGIFDDFEVKWLSSIEIQNPGFEDLLEGWDVTSDTDWIPYTQNDGIEGSKNMAVWNSVDYHVVTSQTVAVPNGKYQVSMWAKISQSDRISLFASSGSNMSVLPLEQAGAYTKFATTVAVTDGSLQFGIKGSGENNLIPANVWGTFDNFEVLRLPDVDLVNPGFEEDFVGWTKDSDTDWMPYIENKGVEGSKSVTYWQSVDYHVSTFQMVSGLLNGEYDVSAMTLASVNDAFVLFGSSGTTEMVEPIQQTAGLTKHKVAAVVNDGTLTVGVKGSGEGNMAPAGQWIVFDNFELSLKRIIPEYPDIKNTLAMGISLGVDPDSQLQENNVIWWQGIDQVTVASENSMLSLALYSLTGTKVIDLKPNSTQVSFLVPTGIYMLRVHSENGVDTVTKIVVK